jgi:hypothetical protein
VTLPRLQSFSGDQSPRLSVALLARRRRHTPARAWLARSIATDRAAPTAHPRAHRAGRHPPVVARPREHRADLSLKLNWSSVAPSDD